MDPQVSNIVFFVVISSFLLLLLAVLVINLLLAGRNRRLQHHAETLELKAGFEKELMKTQVEVAEQTLNDLARDLHDDVGQMLTFSILQINHLSAGTEPAVQKKLNEVRDSVQNTLQSVRGISKVLSNDYLTSFGIRESLERLMERIRKQGLITAEMHFPEGVYFHSRSNELFAFRMIQELISNTIKHSGANQFSISLKEKGGELSLEYRDNGKGLPDLAWQPESLKTSMGFKNLIRRAELMKGQYRFGSPDQPGFYFHMIFPNI